MNVQELTRSIVKRTGLPHDEVDIVLHTMTQIIHERLGVLEATWIPNLCKVYCSQTKFGTWVADVAFTKKTVKAVGSSLRPLHRGTPEGGDRA